MNVAPLRIGLAASRLHRLPTRREGGLIHLVAGVVATIPARRFDAIIYLLDPDHPTSVFPEGQALQRECVIHEAAFVATVAHAREWCELARVTAGFRPDAALDSWFDFRCKTVARGLPASARCASAM